MCAYLTRHRIEKLVWIVRSGEERLLRETIIRFLSFFRGIITVNVPSQEIWNENGKRLITIL